MQNELPALPKAYIKRADEDFVIEMITNEKVTVVHGVSGIGKSEIALGVAHNLLKKFDSVIWVNLGEDIEFNF